MDKMMMNQRDWDDILIFSGDQVIGRITNFQRAESRNQPVYVLPPGATGISIPAGKTSGTIPINRVLYTGSGSYAEEFNRRIQSEEAQKDLERQNRAWSHYNSEWGWDPLAFRSFFYRSSSQRLNWALEFCSRGLQESLTLSGRVRELEYPKEFTFYFQGRTMTNEESMAVCAIRYCIGRRSYIVSDGCAWALKYGKQSRQVRNIVIRDLEEAIDRAKDGYKALGDEMDEKAWRSVLAELQEYSHKVEPLLTEAAVVEERE